MNVQTLAPTQALISTVSESAVLVAELTDAVTTDKALKVYVAELAETLTFLVKVAIDGAVHLALLQSQEAAFTVIVTVSTEDGPLL